MKIILTGADGFVGQHFQNSIPSIPLEDDQGNFINLLDRPLLESSIKKFQPDAIVHLAAISSVAESFKNPEETFNINVIGTLNLLRVLDFNGFSGCMIYIGSGDVYGLVPPDDLPIKESRILKPRSPYSASKVSSEALAYQWSQTGKFDIVLTRPFNHTGPGQNEIFVVSDLAKQIVEIKLGKRDPLIKIGDTDVTRDFTDVRDVVAAYKILLEKGKNGEIYNICSGVERSIGGILNELMKIAGVQAEIVKEKERFRPTEQRRLAGSFEKLHKDTGWAPQIPWKQTLKEMIDDWEEKLA